MNVSVHAHIHVIEIMYKVGLIKECLKILFFKLFDGPIFFSYGKKLTQKK